MKNFPYCLVFVLLTAMFFSLPITGQTQEAAFEDWEKFPVKPTKYPRNSLPARIDATLPWKIALDQAAPPRPPVLENQSLVLSFGDYRARNVRMIPGPPESGVVIVALGVEAFSSPTKKPFTVVHLVSLKQGKMLTKQFPFKMEIYGFSPNGRFLAITPAADESWPKMDNLVILRLDDGSFSPIYRCTPFNDSPSTRRNERIPIIDVFWLNNKQLFLVSQKNTGIQLDLSTQTVGFGIYPEQSTIRSPFVVTPDRKHIVALHDGNNEKGEAFSVLGMGVFSAEDGKQLGYLKAPPFPPRKVQGLRTSWKNLRFSPNGRLLACNVNDSIRIWNFSRGELIGSYDDMAGDRWGWIGNRYLFVSYGGQFLWDAKDQIICSKYGGETDVLDFLVSGDKLIYLTAEDRIDPKEYRLVCSPVIHPDMDEFLQTTARRSERLLGPGDSVDLEFKLRLNSGDRSRVEQHVRQLCVKNGWKIVPVGDSEYHVVVYMSEPGDEVEVRLSDFGSRFMPAIATQKVRPYSVGCSILKGDQLIWGNSKYFGPYRSYESEEEFKQHLTEGMREKPDWFLELWFPQIITRGHMEREKNNATFTIDGIVFESE